MPSKTTKKNHPRRRGKKEEKAKTTTLRGVAIRGLSRQEIAQRAKDKENTAIERFNCTGAYTGMAPASFMDLMDEGLATKGQVNTLRQRLAGRLRYVGERPAKTGRGRPHKLWTVAPITRRS